MPNVHTLRGVFPEPAKVPKRNFIRENMVYIKQMQGFAEPERTRSAIVKNIARETDKKLAPVSSQKTIKLLHTTKKQIQGLTRLSNMEKPRDVSDAPERPVEKHVSKKKHQVEKSAVEVFKETIERNKSKEVGIQTEQFHNLKQLYENGTIIYPSEQVIKVSTQKKTPRNSPPKSPQGSPILKDSESGQDGLPDAKSQTAENKHDFVKENAQVVKNAMKNVSEVRDPTLPPPTYQKGVVPKYLRERKELYKQTMNAEGDERCPEGHVMLPENERRETLRMLKQSYTELITELNMLPVRSDTLKIRNRKMEIENQLKKLDEGIKVFSRPKVFVKIGA